MTLTLGQAFFRRPLGKHRPSSFPTRHNANMQNRGQPQVPRQGLACTRMTHCFAPVLILSTLWCYQWQMSEFPGCSSAVLPSLWLPARGFPQEPPHSCRTLGFQDCHLSMEHDVGVVSHRTPHIQSWWQHYPALFQLDEVSQSSQVTNSLQHCSERELGSGTEEVPCYDTDPFLNL